MSNDMSAIKWNGKERASGIAKVLVRFISDEDRHMARTTMTYGDFGRHLQKRHGECFHGGSVGDDMVQTDSKGVTVTFDFADDGDAYKLTWNQAAKLIHEYIEAYGEGTEDDDNQYDDDDDDDDDEEITDIAPIDDEPMTAETYKDAVSCHAEIIAGAGMAQQGLYQMAQGFKKMRDGRLYKALGYKSFEEYCEKETGFKRRQVYNYISVAEKLSDEFVHSSAQIGVKKLSMLATLSEEQREEIGTDLESVTVKELKAKIDELTGAVEREKQLKEQWHEQVLKEVELSIENAERISKELADRDDEITMLMSKLKELESRPIEVQAVNIEDSEEYRQLLEQRRITKQALLDACNERNELRAKVESLEKQMSDPLDGMKIYAVRMSERQYNKFLSVTKDSNTELFKVLGKAVSI